MQTPQKLKILADAAKFDVACTSSGVDRDAKLGHLGSTYCAGICHSFSADGRCITLLKVLMTNACIYDCAYCLNRSSNDIPRAAFEPRELADLTIQFYKRNYIEGLFLSSGIIRNPDFTMEYMYRTVDILRNEYGFLGYIHVKAIPGASDDLIEKMGYLVDRMSINLELPSEDSLKILAPSKNKQNLLSPMAYVSNGIQTKPKGKPRHRKSIASNSATPSFGLTLNEKTELERYEYYDRFVPAGQSTQLIIGATPESDYQILKLSSALYEMYSLKRVFFSAYLPINDSEILPSKSIETPMNREHRLYQADWLLRFYDFSVDELINAEKPFLDTRLDPKANWALNNLGLFPMEINKVPYEMLLRIPGLGVTGAKKVMRARRYNKLTFDNIQKMGLSIKRMRYFITCNGQYCSPVGFDDEAIRSELIRLSSPAKKNKRSGGKLQAEGQLSLFDPSDEEREIMGEPVGEDCYGTSENPFQEGQLEAFAKQRLLLSQMNHETKTREVANSANRLGNAENHGTGSVRDRQIRNFGELGSGGVDSIWRSNDRSARAI